MASLSKRPRSPFWQIRFRDPVDGARKYNSTPFRWNDRMQTRAARELCARKTYEEKQSPRTTQKDRWEAWVREYLEIRYDQSPDTLSRYLCCWKTVESFLLERKIDAPARVNHAVVMDYVTWRRGARKGGRKAKKLPIAAATIATEVKVWRIVLDEAIRRGWAATNPTLRLHLSRAKTREMRPLTIEEEDRVRDALTNGIPVREEAVRQTNQHGKVFEYVAQRPGREPQEWMLRSFEIAMAQGCRFKETRMPMSDIDVASRRIKIHGKGGKVFETSLNPVLIPMITEWKRRGEKMTWDLPPDRLRQCAREWTRFFRRLGIENFWFHCTRATAITRAHEMKVHYAKAMGYFGHSSGAVHAIYTKLGTQDLDEVGEALASYVSTRRNRYSESPDAPAATGARAPGKSASQTRKRSRPTSSR